MKFSEEEDQCEAPFVTQSTDLYQNFMIVNSMLMMQTATVGVIIGGRILGRLDSFQKKKTMPFTRRLVWVMIIVFNLYIVYYFTMALLATKCLW